MAKTEKLDGRRLRSEQSRENIVDAMLDLLREGHPRPGAQEIAARAGVSLRSVFRHFEDLDGLYTEVSDRQKARIGHLFELPPLAGPLRARIEALIEQRARLYEEIAPMRRAALRLAPFHEPIRVRLAEAGDFLRRHLPEAFAREMDDLTPAERREVLEALEASTSWAFWETLRGDQRLTVERAKRVVARVLLALLR
jgi:AcrR family transcriptional regulator